MENREPEVIIAGFGLPGRVAAEYLAAHDVPFCVIELNPGTVHRCVRAGTPIIEGDCADPKVLIKAGIERAKTFIVVIPDEHNALEATLAGRRLNSTMRIITRCHYTSAGIEAKARGANDVVVAEHVVAAEISRLLRD
jgi:voltage-gated potassium channel Kch